MGIFCSCFKGSYAEDEILPLPSHDESNNGNENSDQPISAMVDEPRTSIHHLRHFESPKSKSSDEDICPTCFEGYSDQNPKIIAKCKHHYHLGCIYDWKERSETCPTCREVVDFARSKFKGVSQRSHVVANNLHPERART
ncbi:hypothetical protein Fmac_003117 [Flemingia macrophylla]|uniref:RING-type E3 ubiquitin transferase n=1 Tax=Flemingia macrophylla TaxID=520843 RepID=A0ABD1NLY1_9FABA